MIDHAGLKRRLESLRAKYDDRQYASPDPIEVVYAYTDPRDAEIAALIAASLAFGNVKTILASCRRVLDVMESPSHFLATHSEEEIAEAVRGFRHRYVAEREMAGLLIATKRAQADHGSLGALFRSGYRARHENVLPALQNFADTLLAYAGHDANYLIPRPSSGSACKRWHMYLRWMIRKDAIDVGLWEGVPRSRLISPMDTHLYRVSKALGFTQRKTPDLRAAIEVTNAFKTFAPRDPIRYDFALTRLGIRTDGDLKSFLVTCGVA